MGAGADGSLIRCRRSFPAFRYAPLRKTALYYPDVQTFTATYRKAEAVVSQHNRELAELEPKVQERQRPAVKERPPEPRSVRERLRRLQDEGKRQQPQPHRRAVDRDSR